jgi:hypothetical protein
MQMPVTLTPEQQAIVNVILKKFADRLLPAKLKNTNRNGLLLADYNVSRGLPINENTLYDAAKAIYATLDWDIKPAKLLAEERESKITIAPSAPKLSNEFEAKVRAGEIADAQAKADEASIKQAKDLISAYLPVKNTPRGQAVDHADQALMQAEWTKALNQAIEKKRNLQVWVKALAETIQKRYRDRERASERM